VDLKASQHYPQRFGQAVTECFLHNYPEVVETVQKTKDKLESNRPKKEAKDHGCKTVRRNIGKIFTVYWFIGLSVLVYRFIGVLVIVVYRFIGLSVNGLSVYRYWFIGLSVYPGCLLLAWGSPETTLQRTLDLSSWLTFAR
jgi:hypothetical protein